MSPSNPLKKPSKRWKYNRLDSTELDDGTDTANRSSLDQDNEMVGTTPDVGGTIQIPFITKGARLDLASRSSRYRWLVIFICSFSGDGWTYESSVLSAIISLPGMHLSLLHKHCILTISSICCSSGIWVIFPILIYPITD